jgi:SAM-dependent methyltransferase
MAGASQRLRGAARSAIRMLPPPRDEAAVDLLRAVRALALGRGRGGTAGPASAARALRRSLDQTFAGGDVQEWQSAMTQLHRVRAHAERLATPGYVASGGLVSRGRGVQSMQFMIDLLPHLQELMAEHPRDSEFEILDVGPGSGVGTALLAQLYASSQLGYRAKVSALDVSAHYQRYLPTVDPNVPFIKANVFDHQHSYDIVIASHVIEHLDDPVPFCRRLQEIARLGVFVVCPFEEPADRLTRGHVRSIDEDLVARLQPEWHTAVRSVAWGAYADPPYRMLIARLPGLAAGGAAVPAQQGSPVSIALDSVGDRATGSLTLPPQSVALPDDSTAAPPA